MKLFLVFGPDEAGVIYNASYIEKLLLEGREALTVRVTFKEIKDNLSKLLDELNSQSLFGEHKVIVLDSVPAAPGKPFLDLLKRGGWPNTLLVIGDDFKPTSAIRKFFEVAKDALCVACYKEDVRQIEGFIREYLQESKYQVDQNVVAEIARILPTNKFLIQNELDKLLLYTLDAKAIHMQDIVDCFADAKELELDDLCVAFALKNAVVLKREIERAERSDISTILILRVLQKYLTRLYELMKLKEQGMSIDTAVGKLMPPVFFKAKDNLVKVARSVTKQSVVELLYTMLKLELSVKKNYSTQYMVLSFELLKSCRENG